MNHTEIKEVARTALDGLKEMDVHCADGLCNYVSCSPYAGQKQKEEKAIHWGITKILQRKWNTEQNEFPYPRQRRKKCDRQLVLSDGSTVWLEVKLAWHTWFYETVKHNNKFMYEGYFFGNDHSHSVADDFIKLEQIGSMDGRYLALLIVGFDSTIGKMSEDMKKLVENENLDDRGWHIVEKSWQTKQSAECWIRNWFAWRQTI